jgi:hypothetical protein
VSSGGLSSQALAGISRIKDQLGVDLTAYAQMSPTLAQEIANATATWDMSFAYDPKGSYLKWDDQVKGTIYINSEYKNNINDFVKGMSHELGHVDHRAADNASKVTSQQYVNEKLLSEGFATLSNERVQHEIYAASGGTIDIGISGNVANRASYDGEYTRYANRQATMLQAASAMSVKYGELERVADGRTYGKYYLDDYYSQGGKW